jgi:hypothetical protein
MSSLLKQTPKPTHRIRSRVIAGVAAIAIPATALVATAAPAQARPRSCANIQQTLMFFALAIQMDTGESASYLAQDTRQFNANARLYHSGGCV